jgi:hypothetical protein
MEESLDEMAANLEDPMDNPVNEAEFFRLIDNFRPYDEAGAINCSLSSENEVAIRALQLNLRLLGYTTELNWTDNNYLLNIQA